MKRWLWRTFWATSLLIAITCAFAWITMGNQTLTLAYVSHHDDGRRDWSIEVDSADKFMMVVLIRFQDRPISSSEPVRRWIFEHTSGHGQLWSWAFGTLGQFGDKGVRLIPGLMYIAARDLKGPEGTESPLGLITSSSYAAIAGFIAPGIALGRLLNRRIRLRRRLRLGQCLSCGYDLRTSPDRCPECGQISLKSVN